MSRTPASIKQADINRSLKAAKQAGWKRLTIMLEGVPFIFDLDSNSQAIHNEKQNLSRDKHEIIL